MGEADKLNRFDIFNTLRALATMFVFILHAKMFIPGISHYNFLAFLPAWAGVWIFFFLSGYLLQKGFNNKKYEGKGLKFYIKWVFKRFLKIGIPYYLYLFFFLIMSGNGSLPSWNIILKLIFFVYNGTGAIDGLDHLWFISILMQLYVLTPLFNMIIEKLKNRPALLTILGGGLLIGGCLLRFFLMRATNRWHEIIYTPFYANLDVYLCGMISSCLFFNATNKLKLKAKVLQGLKIFAWLSFCCFIIVNCWLYGHGNNYAYKVFFPTIYIAFCILFMFLYDCNKLEIEPTKKFNFTKLINIFSKYSFYFYLFHISAIMFVKNLMLHINGYSQLLPIFKYLIFIVLSFIISLMLAYLFDKMIKGLQKRKS